MLHPLAGHWQAQAAASPARARQIFLRFWAHFLLQAGDRADARGGRRKLP